MRKENGRVCENENRMVKYVNENIMVEEEKLSIECSINHHTCCLMFVDFHVFQVQIVVVVKDDIEAPRTWIRCRFYFGISLVLFSYGYDMF